MNIVKATHSYEDWLGEHLSLVLPDLEFKHKQMASAPFAFFRATYYRWCQLWKEAGSDLTEAPAVHAVGDLHVENFGTWRDAEARLVWGINDFDEASNLAFTNDLVRLAVSAELARDAGELNLNLSDACDALLEGYHKSLEAQGEPFVLAENHPNLRAMAVSELRDPNKYWAKMSALPKLKSAPDPKAIRAISYVSPPGVSAWTVKPRIAGLGSLGRPRYLFLAEYEGGYLAREAKGAAPSAFYWASKDKPPYSFLYQSLLDNSVRAKDSYVRAHSGWIARRLGPDCSRIELSQIPAERDEDKLLTCMGFETGNIHLATKLQIPDVLKYLESMPKKWLKKAATSLTDEVMKDFKEWRESYE